MSAPITQNWLTSFKTNLSCGHFPSKTSNPYMEMLTGMVGLQIEYLLCQCPTALDAPEVASANIQDSNRDSLLMWYNKIKCGEFFESDAQAWAVYAMALNKLVECCEADSLELAAEAGALVKTNTDPTDNLYTAVAEDFDYQETGGQTIVQTDADPTTVMLPLNATIPLPIGTKLKVIQGGAGAVTIDAEGAATVVGTDATVAQWDAILLEKIAINTWHGAYIPV